MNDSKEFMGRGFKFPMQVNKETGRFAMSEYEEDIKEAISLILNTNVGERVMRPEFGSNIKEFVFFDTSTTSLNTIKNNLENSLLHFEPRIYNTIVNVETGNNKNQIIVSIAYEVRSTNNQFNMVYPFYLLEGEGV